MAEKYGPASIISLGSQETLVISIWEMSRECFKTHVRNFSDRSQIAATELLGYNFAVFAFAPYGSYWMEMRKIETLELLSNRQIDMLKHIRNSENLMLAGSATTMIVLTWALSLLVKNPDRLKKAHKELHSCVSKDRHVNESDIGNLIYLQATEKETLRLYPATPVIGLHSAMEDCTISPDYHVQAGTCLMVNAWKIHHDECVWPDPHKFHPERFLMSHKDIDVRSRNSELIPFGSGRRSCPGISFALLVVHLTLASLLLCFEVTKPSDRDIDITESPGFEATPLEVYLTPCLPS